MLQSACVLFHLQTVGRTQHATRQLVIGPHMTEYAGLLEIHIPLNVLYLTKERMPATGPVAGFALNPFQAQAVLS